LTIPMKLCGCLQVGGDALFFIASTFFIVGITPSLLIKYLRYSS